MKKILTMFLVLMLILSAAGCTEKEEAVKELPAPETDPGSQFGTDMNINMTTIDQWLGRDDVAYRDVRLLFDPAAYGDIGGEADLTRTIDGFRIVPYPYIATLQSLPVSGAYDGDTLFDVVWNEDGTVADAKANYTESMLILEELFPKDKAVFLMCGGGGYAGMTKTLLLYLGWDEGKLYNIGANWSYDGDHKYELIIYPEEHDGEIIYATWRADYAYIDFTKLHPLEEQDEK